MPESGISYTLCVFHFPGHKPMILMSNDQANDAAETPTSATSTARMITMTARPLTLRLCAADLVCGGLVSTQQGTAHRLWVVHEVIQGAGDGCVEITLRPHS